jgi:hypothetical protein
MSQDAHSLVGLPTPICCFLSLNDILLAKPAPLTHLEPVIRAWSSPFDELVFHEVLGGGDMMTVQGSDFDPNPVDP